jgi:hypothetical protein
LARIKGQILERDFFGEPFAVWFRETGFGVRYELYLIIISGLKFTIAFGTASTRETKRSDQNGSVCICLNRKVSEQ